MTGTHRETALVGRSRVKTTHTFVYLSLICCTIPIPSSREGGPWELDGNGHVYVQVRVTRFGCPSFFTMPPPLLFCCLSILISSLSVLADPSAGSALYPAGLQPLINRANALLSAGTFHDAAKAYSEAIGTLNQTAHPKMTGTRLS